MSAILNTFFGERRRRRTRWNKRICRAWIGINSWSLLPTDRKEMEEMMMMPRKRRTGSSETPNGEFLYNSGRRTPSTESSHYHQKKLQRRRRSCDNQDPTLMLFPSKATKITNTKRQTAYYDQLWRLARLASIMALLFIGSVAGVSAEDIIDDGGGVCPMKCACLDSYIQCTKENLATAPSRVPKWAEFL